MTQLTPLLSLLVALAVGTAWSPSFAETPKQAAPKTKARATKARAAKPKAKPKVTIDSKTLIKRAKWQAKSVRASIKHTAKQKALAKKLQAGLNKKQTAALRRLSNILLQDARQTALAEKKTFTLQPERLRPYVVAIGSKDAEAVAAASMLMALDQAESDVLAHAEKLQKNLDEKAALRQQMTELRDLIRAEKFPADFSYGTPEVTVRLGSKQQAEELLQRFEAQLAQLSDLGTQMNLQLQQALQKQQQVVQILSNIMKNQHETLKAIIQNMKA